MPLSGSTQIYLVGGIGIGPGKPRKAPEWVSGPYGLVGDYDYLLIWFILIIRQII